MASGNDLVRCFRKLGCPGAENIDGNDLDWQFENLELAKFFKEFCTRVDSGELRAGDLKKKITKKKLLVEPENEEFDKKNVLVEQILSESGSSLKIKKRIEQLKDSISFKKQQRSILEMKLQQMKDHNLKTEAYIAMLESSSSKNIVEAVNVKKRIEPLQKMLGDLLNTLSESQAKLLTGLLEASSSNSKTKVVNSDEGNISPDSELLKAYLDKEEKLFHQIEEFAELENSTPCQNPDNEASVLLEEWQNEQHRLHKCFHMTLTSYNNFIAIESALRSEISFLQKLLNREKKIQGNRNDIEQAQERVQSLESTIQDLIIKNDEACEELATLSLSSLMLENFKIKLERLECHKNSREKILQWLQAEQKRLSFLQLTYKLKCEGNLQLLKICKDVTTSLGKYQANYQNWIASLMSVKASQYPPERAIISSADKVMRTAAEVLGSDKEELLPTYDSTVKAAISMKYKMESDESSNEKTLNIVLRNIEELEVISELLYQIQDPLKKKTFHGNPQLNDAVKNLYEEFNSFASSVIGYQKSFQGFRKLLKECDREVHERKQKIKLVQAKISQE